jgi:glycosyltransferase involved in cell wall biosynthesis
MTPEHQPLDLAVAICTMNNMRTIERALRSVLGLARRIVVVDSGSTDGTIELCRSLGVELLHRKWEGLTIQRQYALDQCAEHRWVLLLDSDEALEPDLRRSIDQIVAADDPRYDGWEINRKVWFLDGWLHYTFQPEWRLRLVRGGAGRVVGIGPEGQGGHDRVVIEGRAGRLDGFCRHDSWRNLEDMFRRHVERGRRAARFDPRGGTIFHILCSPPAAMIKQLLLRRGYRDGRRGIIVAAAVGAGTLIKHLFIAQRRAGLEKDET